MKTALISTSLMVMALAIAASYVLPSGMHPGTDRPYVQASLR